jgi:hypothetical protein
VGKEVIVAILNKFVQIIAAIVYSFPLEMLGSRDGRTRLQEVTYAS